MNRRSSFKLIMAGTLAVVAGVEGAKKKNKKKGKGNKKGGGKKGGGNRTSQKDMKISGEIVLVEEDITRLYKIVGGKVYSFARSVEDKVKSYVGQKVTVHGRVYNDRIMAIEVVVAGK